MLSLGIVTGRGVGYYLDTVASGIDDYYVRSAPGWWTGAGADRLGLAGRVERDQLLPLLDGRHPSTGERLGGQGGKVSAFDLTFSAPKGVSVLAGLASPSIAAQVMAAHERAVRQAIVAVETYAAGGRRGAGGTVQVPVEGIAAAGFTHHTSRAGDPQLHTHVLVLNRARGADGRWGGLYGQRLFAWAKTAGHLYQAALRAELAETHGVRFGPVHNGTAEPEGLTGSQLRAFSARRADIENELATLGLNGPRAAQLATLATRPAKPEPLDFDEQRRRWWEEAHAAGITADRITGLVGPARTPVIDVDLIAAKALAPTGLTAHASTFDLRDVLQACADSSPAGAHVDDVAASAWALLGRSDFVPVEVTSRLGGTRWTTAELLATEHRLLDTASRLARQSVGLAPPRALAAALDSRPTLSPEQRRMVEVVCSAPGGIAVVVGRPGTGKTFALDAARDAWATSGIPVIGAALAARAAAELQAATGIASTTVAQLLVDLDRPQAQCLPRGGVVVIDEAAMVGTRDLARLLAVAEHGRTRVVLIGDAHQIPEISAGGAFGHLARSIEATVELTANRRQAERWERVALDQLRCGDAAGAVTLYREHGRLTLAASAEAVRDAMVSDWWEASCAGSNTLMVAVRRSDVEELNRRARQRREAAGLLGDVQLEAGGRTYATGDVVIATRNDRRAGLTNGTRARVVQVDLTGRSLTLQTTDGRDLVVSARYMDNGHLAYGDATTAHKAQGATVDRAFLLGSAALYKEVGYTALSRATSGTDLYQIAPAGERWEPAVDPLDELARLLGRSRAQSLASALAPTDEQPGPSAATLADLYARRREIEPRLADHEHTTATDGDLRQWSRLTRAINHRSRLLTAAALADPGPHLIARLGPPPQSGPARSAWAKAAGAIDIYRDRYVVTGLEALGPVPDDTEQAHQRRTAEITTQLFDHQLDLDQGLHL
jgi:conjugative relaxase-like TrwC/TraI family protein